MGEDTTSQRRIARFAIIGGVAALIIAAVLVALWITRPDDPSASTPTPSASETRAPSPVASPTDTPAPPPPGFPADTASYDLASLPQVTVFSVVPALPVDDAPFTVPTEERALPRGDGAPVWADPNADPVAYLPRSYDYGGTTVPIVERQEHWVRVLLVGRQAVPSQGNPAQVTGWLRTADVEISPAPESVVVSISARTIDIVRDGVAERIASDFAWGTDATPTPVGRSYIMTTQVVPEYGYTRGHPIVYLSVQSPTLDGFGGADVAVTAFHYHDARSGAISNGCLRVDPDAITKLAALPLGTPVIVNP
ncbi:L,D-transpeptidase [Microbacterium yannicii]|uniref:L,D-transpeptidase n=1 Tax=Microbacterium yannicii TaxID=671622 RepID=UPI000303220D|nr:L,D-transpeptidase [Microbacterium yannicii]